MVEVHYVEGNCFCWTFEEGKVKEIVEKECRGRVLNLFAGKTRLDVKELRVDVSPEFSPDICIDAGEFLEKNGETFETIIYDPPWNERKAKEFYNDKYIGKFTKLKDAIVETLSPGGRIISLGYEIANFGKKRGMNLENLYVIDPRGEIRPYFVSVEVKNGFSALSGKESERFVSSLSKFGGKK